MDSTFARDPERELIPGETQYRREFPAANHVLLSKWGERDPDKNTEHEGSFAVLPAPAEEMTWQMIATVFETRRATCSRAVALAPQRARERRAKLRHKRAREFRRALSLPEPARPT